jgi:sugar O-acyltransferase (sialic acid O-acetyltransferase NeuD family)
MKKPNILLLGAGGHARCCIEVIETNGVFNILGLIGESSELGRKELGHEVIANDAQLGELRDICDFAIVAVGQIKSPQKRIQLFDLGKSYGYEFPSIVAPTAHVSKHASIGDGSIVMPGSVIMPGAKVGQNCIVNSQSLVEHDTTVEDHCHISTGAVINGGSKVGRGSFVGSGTVTKEGITIGSDCFIGMGQALKQDVAAGHKYFGTEYE